MKLVRHGPSGHERPGMIDAQGQIRDLSGVCDDFGPKFFADDGLARLRSLNPASLPSSPRARAWGRASPSPATSSPSG